MCAVAKLADAEGAYLGTGVRITGLLFNDHTPFISEQTKQWLAASPDAKVAPVAQIGEESKAA
ncbi:type VI secretion system protein TssA, partial [Escherichia coli]|nr:type VI secretion system protein TssA [Escherichia coli]